MTGKVKNVHLELQSIIFYASGVKGSLLAVICDIRW